MTKVITYVRSSLEEMKKVTWPSKKETKNYTTLVIVVSLAIAAFLGALDYIFTYVLEQIINK